MFSESRSLKILVTGDVNYLAKRVLDIVGSLRMRVMQIIRLREREIDIEYFLTLKNIWCGLSIEKIVADTKVSPEAIELYKQKIRNGEKIAPIIVVKHPKFELYAVLDGHHRYYTYLELGKKEVSCAIAGDFSTVFFYMAKNGFFQPNPETKGEMRNPVLQLRENIQDFLNNFLKDPDKLRKPKRDKLSD